jgi:hypothetical protein
MPSTVASIFAAAGVTPAGVVRWGDRPALPVSPSETRTGIYMVALTDRRDQLEGELAAAPLSDAAVKELLAVRAELTLDRARPTRAQLAARLAAFWLPDEVVLYIGLAGTRKNRPRQGELAKRVEEYYGTPLGARSPHAGGWPLKMLSCLAELFVHYGYCDHVDEAEGKCIGSFADGVASETRSALHDPVRVMPFANLEFPKGNPKNHGIRGARAPKTARVAKDQPTTAATAPASAARAPGPARTRSAGAAPARTTVVATSRHRSQNVTANDIAAGQVRIPIGATKRILPQTRQDISVVLRGRVLTCRWDPRYGEKERSGVIRVGKAAAVELLAPGDVLAVSLADGEVRLH